MLNSNQLIHIDKELCTGCGRCKEVCPVEAISGVQGEPHSIDHARCVICGQCIQTCSAYGSILEEPDTPLAEKLHERGMFRSVEEPLFAAYCTGNAPEVMKELRSDKLSLVQCAPAVRTAIGEDFGMPAGSLTPGKMAAALRRLGFDRVYDTNFAADLTIMEEGNELLSRISNGETLPMFTSCCPAWVRFMELNYPDLLGHLSSCKSPQQMSGALFKTYGADIDNRKPEEIFSVSVMPCTCKKYESSRPEMKNNGLRDVDAVITTRELGYMIKEAGIDFTTLPAEDFDRPLGTYTGAGNIFGVTGGVMEAALRTACELVTGKPVPETDLIFVRGEAGMRTASMDMNGTTFRVAVVAGLTNAIALLEKVRTGKAEVDFVEVMCCPSGCISGGGQPKVLLPADRENVYRCRKQSMYSHDQNIKIRKSHENPDVQKVYADFLGEPLGHTSHKLLHTSYDRKDC
ncbi:[FeFe] hydrogenase, group A [Maridesulfovibrio hydrothermalis]|uniref:Periplasmic [Fe] hydrogenase large subunit n=1 Tax=Maridesulfovibrio hydrothermalis AM13 = DSM 14728 TaxID=1121451 RepID=L0REX5_9BACT|nr:[FeFe] hydrogenase, group A [Maridesulfovibrio hydrothermalis]CCO24762.1 Periplasmic [Fe] hydrogenase large subunit [Maridesulfovibrio hydrothermalis AM13 = DSM 14728]